jgi:hypothetical protein
MENTMARYICQYGDILYRNSIAHSVLGDLDWSCQGDYLQRLCNPDAGSPPVTNPSREQSTHCVAVSMCIKRLFDTNIIWNCLGCERAFAAHVANPHFQTAARPACATVDSRAGSAI